MTPQDFFAVFGFHPAALVAYALLHLHIVATNRRSSRLEARLTRIEAFRITLQPERPTVDPKKLARLKELQLIPIADLHPIESMELEQLRRELAQRPELADDPATPFVDESQRPNIGGGDYMKDRDADTRRRETEADMREVVADVKEGVGFLAWLIRLFRGGR